MGSEFMKYAIDRFENNLAILENLETKEIIEIDVKKLPSNICEGSILVEDNGIYVRDLSTEKARRDLILEKFNKLKKK